MQKGKLLQDYWFSWHIPVALTIYIDYFWQTWMKLSHHEINYFIVTQCVDVCDHLNSIYNRVLISRIKHRWYLEKTWSKKGQHQGGDFPDNVFKVI